MMNHYDRWQRSIRALTQRLDRATRRLREEKPRRASAASRAATAASGRELLAWAVESGPDGIVAIGRGGRIDFANGAAEEILGVARGRAIGRAFDGPASLFTGPDGAPLTPDRSPHSRVLATGRAVHGSEVGYRRPDGERLTLSISAAPIRDHGGAVVAVVATIRDVTRSKRALERLRDGSDRYRLIRVATNDAIWDWDLLTDEVTFNDAVGTMFRFTPGEVGEGKDWLTRHIHPGDRDRVTAGIRAALGSGAESWSDEYRFRRGDGTYADVLDRGRIARDERGAPVRMIGSLLDITDKKRAEGRQRVLDRVSRELASSLDVHEMLRTLAKFTVPNLADYCVIDLVEGDAPRRVATVHRDPAREEVARELGRRYPPGAASRSRVASVLRTGEPEMIPEITPEYLEAVAEDADHLELMRRLAMRSAMVVPLTARGRTLGVIVLTSCRTDHFYDDDDLAFAIDLAARAALMVDNVRLYREAEQASRAKSEFLAVMSHEFRTPLMAIIGYTDLLDTGALGTLTEDQKLRLGYIRASAWHVSGLVEEVLAYARLETDRLRLEVEQVDVASLIGDAIALVEPAVAGKEIAVEASVPADLPRIETDAVKLRQILLNLLDNAVKFTQAGRVKVAARIEQDALVLEVTDTGIGVSQEDLRNLFEPFWQVDQSPTRRAGGAGLGLSVTRRLARLLGGDVSVESAPGQGSTFRAWVAVNRTNDRSEDALLRT